MRVRTIVGWIRQLYVFFVDLIAPPSCAFCHALLPAPAVFCNDCATKMRPVVSQQLVITKTKSITVHAIAQYNEPIKSLIRAKHGKSRIASQQLGELVCSHTLLAQQSFDYLVPIPLHWTRRLHRGFNQAHEMAHVMSAQHDISVVSLLKRHRYTKFQARLKVHDRADNIKSAFSLSRLSGAHKKKYEGTHLVLVDDLMTTGGTLREAAKVLYQLKPASITAFVAARAVKNTQ